MPGLGVVGFASNSSGAAARRTRSNIIPRRWSACFFSQSRRSRRFVFANGIICDFCVSASGVSRRLEQRRASQRCVCAKWLPGRGDVLPAEVIDDLPLRSTVTVPSYANRRFRWSVDGGDLIFLSVTKNRHRGRKFVLSWCRGTMCLS
jgi:hypothetical protein